MARSGDLEELKNLLSKNLNQNLLNQALEAAVIGRQPEAIKLLISHGANVNYIDPGGTALLVNAIMREFYDSAQILIESGADPNVMGYNQVYYNYPVHWHWTPLMAASYKGHFDLVKLLLQKDAQINAKGYSVSEDSLETAADIAAYSGHLKIFKYLRKKKAKFSDNLIFKAARGGHLEVVSYFLNHGFDINAKEPHYGKTLLMETAWWGHIDIVKFLIHKGADINATSQNGYTALSEAASNSQKNSSHHLEIVKVLIANGADVRQAEQFKLTPLMRAKDPAVIQLLIEAGAR